MLETVEHVVAADERADAAAADRHDAGGRPEAGRARGAGAQDPARERPACGPRSTVDAAAAIHVRGHEDRLERVIGHLVQNALDATGETGRWRCVSSATAPTPSSRSPTRGGHDARVRARSPVQAVRDDQAARDGHRRLRELPVRHRARRADPRRQHAERRHPSARVRWPSARSARPVRNRCGKWHEPAGPSQGRTPSAPREGSPMSSPKRKPLLIVEDDPALQKQMRWAFDQYETVVADDRESAVAQLRRHEPAVVTMDLGLPPRPGRPGRGAAAARRDPRARPGHQGDRADRTERPGERAQGDRARRLRLLRQAVRARDPGPDDRSGLPPARAAGGEPPPAALPSSRRAVRGHHPRSGDAAHLPDDREGRADDRDRPDPRRIRDRQGAPGARRCTSCRRGARSASSRSTARRFPRTCWRASSSATRRARSPAPARQTLGKIETAHRGTLFLDEIGDLPLALQAKLLRFLQERVIERVGGREEIPVDVRIVCATHQNLKRPDRGRPVPRGPLLPAGRDRPRDSAAARSARATRACSRTRSSAGSRRSSGGGA